MNKYVEYLWNLVIYHRERRQQGSGRPAVLIICRQPLGDTVLASPLIRGIRRIYPEHHLMLIASESNFHILEHCPYADEVLVYEAQVQGNYLRSHLNKARAFAEAHFQGYSFEVAVIPSTGMPSTPEAWLAYFSGAKRRVSFSEKYKPAMHEEFMGGYDRYFTDVPYSEEICHEVESNVSLLNLLQPGEYDSSLELWPGEADRQEARLLLQAAGVRSQGLKAAVCLSTSELARDWPAERYAEVCRSLQEKWPEISFVLVGTGERARAYRDIFLKKNPRAYDMTDRTSLGQLMALLQTMDLYLGGDTGTLHMAAACQLRGAAVYRSADNLQNRQSQDAKLRYPWQCDITVLKPKKALPGCEEGCFFGKPHCILQVDVSQVLQAMEKAVADCQR